MAIFISVEWDYGSGENVNVQISNRKIILKKSITVGHLSIDDGGVLVFGEPETEGDTIELRALAISVREGGELWIGNTGCRYQYDATITLYGDNQAMKNGWFFDPEDTWLDNSSSDTSKGRVVKKIPTRMLVASMI